MQLAAGANQVDVVPEGSKVKEDLIAGVLEALTKNPDEFAKITENVISEVEAFVLKLVGTDITDEMAMISFANPVTDPVAVPTERTVAEPLAEHTNQVKVAVKESLATALDGFRTSLRANAVLGANPIPAGVPMIGSGNKISIGSMLQFLPSIQPGGSDAVDMPMQGNLASTATRTLIIEYTNNSIKYKKYGVKYVHNFPSLQLSIATNSLEVVTITGINVESKTAYNRNGEADGKYISRISATSGWEASIEKLNHETEALLNRLTIKPETGFSFDINYNRSYEIGTYTIDAFTLWGGTTEHRTFLDYYARIERKTAVSFAGNNKLSATYEEPGFQTSNFCVSFDGLSGSFVVNQTGFIGTRKYGSYDTVKEVFTFVQDYSGGLYDVSVSNKKYFMPVEQQNYEQLPVFVNNQLVITAEGNYLTEGFELQSLKVTLPNLTKLANPAEGHPVDYTFTGGTANAVLVYNGNEPELYGYIRRLQAAVSNLSYDSISNEMGDGTQFVFTKTNTDGTNNVLTYKVVNGKTVLQPVTQDFTGGSETVSSDGSNTTIEGSVAVKGSDATTVNLNYNTNKSSDGSIAVKVDLQTGGSTKTIFFTRDASGMLTGRFYLIQKSADDSQNLLAQFTIYNHGMGTLTYSEGSGQTGTISFYLSL